MDVVLNRTVSSSVVNCSKNKNLIRKYQQPRIFEGHLQLLCKNVLI